MKNILSKFAYLIDLVKKGEIKFLVSGIKKRMFSTNLSYGLKRDLNLEIPTPPSLLKLEFRLYRPADAPFFELDNSNHGLVEKNIDHCYVATKDDMPVYRVWLMGSNENKKIQDFWGDAFPSLNPNEVLCENSYTVPKFRGFGIMPLAMKTIAEKGLEMGADTAIIYTAIDHMVSLRAGDYAGYHPYVLRTEKWRFFKRSTSFSEIPEDLMVHYKKVTQRRRPKRKQAG